MNELEDLMSSVHCTTTATTNGDATTTTTTTATTNGTTTTSAATAVQHNDSMYYKEQLAEIRDEFHLFLKTYCNILHKPTTYKLISSHGRNDELLDYAALIEDYERVISHWIVEKDWEKALEVLAKQVIIVLGKKDASMLTHFYCIRPILISFTSFLLS